MDSFVRLKALYDEQGDQDYIGEPVSQREHALQAAAHARASGAPKAAVLAALLHDVGHLQYPSKTRWQDSVRERMKCWAHTFWQAWVFQQR